MKKHGFYPFPQQNGNHLNTEFDFENKVPQTLNIERRIQELEHRNERNQLNKIKQVEQKVSQVNSAVDHVNQKVNKISQKNHSQPNRRTKNPWDDEIIPFHYSKED